MSSTSVNFEGQKKAIAEQIWLQYFNRVLFEKGLISEEELNRMANRINSRNNTVGCRVNQLRHY